MKCSKNKNPQFTCFQILKNKINNLSYIDSCEAHIVLEFEISNTIELSYQEKLELLTFLFITSLRRSVYHHKSLISRVQSLVISPNEKQQISSSILDVIKNRNEMYNAAQPPFFKIKSMQVYRYRQK